MTIGCYPGLFLGGILSLDPKIQKRIEDEASSDWDMIID
jgi:hypothetical protein